MFDDEDDDKEHSLQMFDDEDDDKDLTDNNHDNPLDNKLKFSAMHINMHSLPVKIDQL